MNAKKSFVDLPINRLYFGDFHKALIAQTWGELFSDAVIVKIKLLTWDQCYDF
jgi:hypothetical protein